MLVADDIDKLIRWAESQGWIVQTDENGYRRFYSPAGDYVVRYPATPSNPRRRFLDVLTAVKKLSTDLATTVEERTPFTAQEGCAVMADEWTVSLVLATDEPLPEDTLVRMDELVEKGAATVAARGKDGPGFSLTMDVETEHFGNAVDETVRIAYDVADQVNILVRPVELHVMAPELFEKRALEPDFPPLASAADAAEILGVSRQRVHQLHASNTRFPAPVTRVATGPLWAVPAIEHFAEVWERKPGRPSAPGRPAQPVAATRTGR